MKYSALLVCLSICIQASCSAPMRSVNETNVDALIGQFQSGQIVLSDSPSMIANAVASQSESKTLYSLKDWESLAKLIIRIDYAKDVNYFYLGRSAEGLKLNNAAAIYYRLALQTPYKCFKILDGCQGFDFPRDIVEGLKRVSNQAR